MPQRKKGADHPGNKSQVGPVTLTVGTRRPSREHGVRANKSGRKQKKKG